MELKIKSIKKLISERMVQDYAEVSGDYNPIHLDEDYAKKTEFKNKIVHGMLLISNITEIMFKNFGNSWNKNGTLKMISFFAKKGRGMMVRYLLDVENLSAASLLNFDYGGYAYSEEHTASDLSPVFIR